MELIRQLFLCSRKAKQIKIILRLVLLEIYNIVVSAFDISGRTVANATNFLAARLTF